MNESIQAEGVDGIARATSATEAVMTEKAIEFLQEWINEKVQAPEAPIEIDREAEVLARQCAAQAADAGVRIEDIEEEVGDLEELIAAKLEDAVEAKKGNPGAPS